MWEATSSHICRTSACNAMPWRIFCCKECNTSWKSVHVSLSSLPFEKIKLHKTREKSRINRISSYFPSDYVSMSGTSERQLSARTLFWLVHRKYASRWCSPRRNGDAAVKYSVSSWPSFFSDPRLHASRYRDTNSARRFSTRQEHLWIHSSSHCVHNRIPRRFKILFFYENPK